MQPFADVSYPIPVYNKAQYLESLVDSIDRQDVDTKEIVFADDASTDGSRQVIEGMIRRRSRTNLTIKLIPCNVNAGPSRALGVAIRHSTAPWVHFVDADDVLTDWASRHVLDLAERHRADMVYGRQMILGVNPPNPPPGPRKVGAEVLPKLVDERLLGVRFACLRELAVVGPDERIFVQDVSLPLRIAARAQRLAVTEAVLVRVRDVAGSVSKNWAQETNDFIGATALFLLEHHVPRTVRSKLVRRCLRRERRFDGRSVPKLEELGAAFGFVLPGAATAILARFEERRHRLGLRGGAMSLGQPEAWGGTYYSTSSTSAASE